MSDYKRFISYLFWYEGNERQFNTGFAKVEQRQGICRIELHIKKCPVIEKKVKVYVFFRKGNRLLQIPVGIVEIANRQSDDSVTIEEDALRSYGYTFAQICGVVIDMDGENRIASQWDDGDIDWNRMGLPQVDTQEKPMNISKDYIDTGEQSVDIREQKLNSSEKAVTLEGENPERGDKMEDVNAELLQHQEHRNVGTENSSQQGVAAELEALAMAPMPELGSNVQRIWRQLIEEHTKINPFCTDQTIWAIRISLEDLKRLPEKYQQLGNNNFLLHGYYNYRLLVLGYMPDWQKWFLGVPGTFENQELILATIFGFPQFRTEQDCMQKTGEFGYWFRFLD